MPKRTFTPAQWLHLTELAHSAALAGLTTTKRWALGEIKFQGGTSLHLVHGSPRYSEDLDFLAKTDMGLQSALLGTLTHIRSSFAREFPQMAVTLKTRDEEGADTPRNPRVFTFAISEPDWHQTLKVKVEFYIVEETAIAAYQSTVMPIRPVSTQMRVDIPPAYIETGDLSEILVDKIYALGDRKRIKERDLFDLWWICSQNRMGPDEVAQLFLDRHEAHFAMYPNSKSPSELAASYLERAAVMQSMLDTEPGGLEPMIAAIGRWLPVDDGPNVYASVAAVRGIVEHAIACAHSAARAMNMLVQDDAPGITPERPK